MITKVSVPVFTKDICINNSPSFGLAKLNDYGRATVQDLQMPSNKFLIADMFKKQSGFRKPLLVQRLNRGESFLSMCNNYGCSHNPKANADFIDNQVLNSKSLSAIKKVDKDEYFEALNILFKTNYDNPKLSLKSTKKLLSLLQGYIPKAEHAKYAGILDTGVSKK